MSSSPMPRGLRAAFADRLRSRHLGAQPDAGGRARQQELVDWVFTRVADRYDLGNDIMSLGWHTRWKRRLIDYIDPAPGTRALDIACGTGDVTWMLAERGCDVVGCDISEDMMRSAPSKRPAGLRADVRFEQADAMALPYPDDHFDLVTIVYAGRGFPDFPAVLAEAYRVLRPGGHMWNLDFARPPSPTFDKVYRGYMLASGAVLGTVLHGHPKTYMYIPISMRAYPGQRWLDHQLQELGFETELIETFAGIMAYNHGRKPEGS